MSHINYNHLYYFWHVYKEGSVVGAAEALFLTPQTITGQIKAWRSACRVNCLSEREGAGAERAGGAGLPLCRPDVYPQPGDARHRQLSQRVESAV
jgi:hypothetical protein